MIDNHNLKHLAVILDGNRRWAKENGLPQLEGHRRGYDKVKLFGDWCFNRGIDIITVWAFSTENWKRSAEEVSYLMDLIIIAVKRDLDYYHKKNIKIQIIGRREPLPVKVLAAIDNAHEVTKNNTGGILNICINYGGQPEIVDAVKKIIKNGHKEEDVNEELITSYLYKPELPFPDLIVRTSGEQRLSGYLLWESAYSEYLFLDKHWPAIEESDVDYMIEQFMQRQRRFGGDVKK